MRPEMEMQMVENGSITSRRSLLGALAIVPVAALPDAAVGASWDATASALPDAPSDTRVPLRRSREGRSLSRFRYHNAERFFTSVEQGLFQQRCDEFYHTGIVLQLGLSSHLLDVGFDDAWCARHLGLDVAKSLACAEATGLDHDSASLARLAEILSPYGKWRNADVQGGACDCPFSSSETRSLARALLDRVREVTGHPRPRGWRRSSR
jgi:hypothetical protein